jgi:hypothetical protein
MQGLKLQGKPFYLVSTDVKGAFSGVPTDFAGQRYGSMGISDTDRLFDFLQAIDVRSKIRVRVRHGFSRAVDKGEIGIHQGEVLSPGKYGWSLDPLLVYLDKVAVQHQLGIDLASLRLDGQEIDYLPASQSAQARIEPIYETIEGWSQTSAGARSWLDLPAQAIKYVRRVEELIGAPVALVSTSPEREDTILVQNPFET